MNIGKRLEIGLKSVGKRLENGLKTVEKRVINELEYQALNKRWRLRKRRINGENADFADTIKKGASPHDQATPNDYLGTNIRISN